MDASLCRLLYNGPLAVAMAVASETTDKKSTSFQQRAVAVSQTCADLDVDVDVDLEVDNASVARSVRCN